MHLLDFANDIFDIAKHNNVDYGVAKDMFMANIRNYGDPDAPYYNGADTVNYASLKEHVNELDASTIEFHDVVFEHYQEIVALREAGDYEAVNELLKI